MRQYGHYERRPAWGVHATNSMVNKIIAVNIAVHLFKYFSTSPMTIIQLFGLSPKAVITQFHIWQPVTYMFLHADFWHLFFNMLMTWFIGNTLEAGWGSRKFLKYYILCGLGGAAFSAVFNFSGPPIIGASAAVFGLYLAYAMLYPNNYVLVYFLFPVKAKHLVTFLAIAQLAMGIAGPAGIAYFAHLGGMAAGLLFFKRQLKNAPMWTRLRRMLVGSGQGKKQNWDPQESAKIDSILDKIASKGFENLSTTEKRILENYSRKQKEDSE